MKSIDRITFESKSRKRRKKSSGAEEPITDGKAAADLPSSVPASIPPAATPETALEASGVVVRDLFSASGFNSTWTPPAQASAE